MFARVVALCYQRRTLQLQWSDTTPANTARALWLGVCVYIHNSQRIIIEWKENGALYIKKVTRNASYFVRSLNEKNYV